MAICVWGLDSACLYAFLRLRGEAMTLKHKKESVFEAWSVFEAFMLAAYGFWQVYICSVKMVLHQQCSSKNKRWGQKAWAKG